MTTRYDHFEVSISASWTDWRFAAARLADLRDVHWHQPAGAPHRMVHAYVRRTAIVRGDLRDGCDTASPGHDMLVCVLRRHNIPDVYAELARRADRAAVSALPSTSVRGGASVGPGR